MSALDATMQRLAREARIVFEQCFEMAVQRLVDDKWIYRDTVGRCLGVGVNDAWAMPHSEVREKALKVVSAERARITHYSHNRPRYLAGLELAEAAKRLMERAA